jgi:hypothetical protein
MPGGRRIPPSGRDRMVRSRETQAALPRAWTLATVATLGLASAGCTMCPDPFDYSGPVPNGSSPQNDFRARSNGILPLGAAPKPWPLLVKDGSGDAGRSRDDEPTPTLAEEPAAESAEATTVEQTIAVVGEFEGETVEAGHLRDDGDPTDAPQQVLEPVPSSDRLMEGPNVEGLKTAAAEVQGVRGDQPATDVTEVWPAAPASSLLPPVRTVETPGWRARRR